MPSVFNWPTWFKFTLTAAVSLSGGAFAMGQVVESKIALASQALEAAGEARGLAQSLTPRVNELEAWRRGEEASRAALTEKLSGVAAALADSNKKMDDLAKSVHRIEGAVLGADKPK